MLLARATAVPAVVLVVVSGCPATNEAIEEDAALAGLSSIPSLLAPLSDGGLQSSRGIRYVAVVEFDGPKTPCDQSRMLSSPDRLVDDAVTTIWQAALDGDLKLVPRGSKLYDAVLNPEFIDQSIRIARVCSQGSLLGLQYRFSRDEAESRYLLLVRKVGSRQYRVEWKEDTSLLR